jgi:membrane dipeptidase
MAGTDPGSAHGPWVDVHAHPGRCFLAGLDPTDGLIGALGAASCEQSLAEIGEAGVAAVSFATVSDLRVLGPAAQGGLEAVRPFADGEAFADHRRQLSALGDLATRHRIPIVRSAGDILAAHGAGTTALFMTCEGADFVEDDLSRLDHAHDAGVRSITLVHYRQNACGDLQTAPPVHGGLSTAGGAVVREMNRLGMVIDVAHATYETTLGVLELSSDPIMISHTHLGGDGRDNPRLISTEHARAVASQGGLVGAWPAGVSSATFDDFIDEIIRLVEVVGVEHVGIGTDMDANFRPVVTSYGQFASIGESLRTRGLTPDESDRILGGNAVALIRSVCG